MSMLWVESTASTLQLKPAEKYPEPPCNKEQLKILGRQIAQESQERWAEAVAGRSTNSNLHVPTDPNFPGTDRAPQHPPR